MDDLAEFRAGARAWLEANAEPLSADDNPAALFLEHEDEDAHVDEARGWQAKLFDAGWTGIDWPEEFGGRGLSPMHQIVWQIESSRYRIPTEVFGIGLGMGGPTVMAWGTEAQKQRWLRPMLRGEEIWCQLFSEPNAGSDVAGVQTGAKRDGDHWVATGRKTWTSGARYSRWGMLLARTDPDVPKHRGLTYFVVDMHRPGIEITPIRQMTGGTNFTEVSFDGVRIDEVLGAPGMGWSVAVTTLMSERASIGGAGGLASGSGTRAMHRLLEEIRAATGTDPTADEALRDRVVEAVIRVRVIEYHAGRIIGKLERGKVPTAEASVVKLLLGDLLERMARVATDASGPRGMLAGGDALSEGRWAQALLAYPGMRIAGGTDQILRSIIGERVLGLPREPRVDREVPFRDIPTGA